MRDAKLYVVDGAEHMPMNQRPAAFNETLLNALRQPPSAAPAVKIDNTPRGNARCVDQPGMRYTGSYESISLQNCAKAVIVNARVNSIRAVGSSLTLENTVVESQTTALDVAGSSVTATAATIKGRVAIRANASRLDLAGVTLRASEKGIDLAGSSRIYFSVSEYDAPDYRGDAHFTWPPVKK
jgi:hypothetical protein